MWLKNRPCLDNYCLLSSDEYLRFLISNKYNYE